MGHVGLTPQTATAIGGYKAQGRTARRAAEVAEDAEPMRGRFETGFRRTDLPTVMRKAFDLVA